MAEKVDVIVVGAGLAGLFCAWELSGAGLDVLVLERGDTPGAKNVSGGRLYLHPVREFAPELWENAPLERPVVRERLTAMSDGGSVTIDLTSDRLREQPWHSATVLRSTFDRWLAEQVEARGAMIVPKMIVRTLAKQGERVIGIVQAEEEIHADVVVAADGVLSFLGHQAGLRSRPKPEHSAVGVKEIIELPPERIEDRFGVGPGEGAAQLYFGSISRGILGGGFAYANQNTISLGMVVGIEGLMRHEPPVESYTLYEEFKQRPEVRQLVAGGTTVEYSAHVVPEGGIDALPQLVGDGILLAGDAAGLGLNLGVTVRGMDFAIASGVHAARAILQARKAGDFTRAGLAGYEKALRESWVLQDMKTFRHMHELLENPRMYGAYPEALVTALEKLFWIDAGPKRKLSAEALAAAKQLGVLQALKDALTFRKV